MLPQSLAANWLPMNWQDLTVLVAVSGGADSVSLLRAMVELRATAGLRAAGAGRLVVGHFNHRLRGEHAEADEQFVIRLCEQLSLDCQVGRAGTPGVLVGGDGLEAAARDARYEFLQHTAEQLGARYVVTAHTADDQAETILHHVLRGAGLAGLAGMRRTRPLGPAVTLIRPMLNVTRDEVLGYLAALDQPFREDATNRDRQFMRNRIRHELLPLMKRDYSPAIVDSLLRLGKLAADAQRLIDADAQRLLDASIVHADAARVTLDCRQLAGADRHLVREALVTVWRRQQWPLQAMGFAEWDLLADMALTLESAAGAENCKRIFPGAITAQRQDEQLAMFASPER